jgi:hypothetical protein
LLGKGAIAPPTRNGLLVVLALQKAMYPEYFQLDNNLERHQHQKRRTALEIVDLVVADSKQGLNRSGICLRTKAMWCEFKCYAEKQNSPVGLTLCENIARMLLCFTDPLSESQALGDWSLGPNIVMRSALRVAGSRARAKLSEWRTDRKNLLLSVLQQFSRLPATVALLVHTYALPFPSEEGWALLPSDPSINLQH